MTIQEEHYFLCRAIYTALFCQLYYRLLLGGQDGEASQAWETTKLHVLCCKLLGTTRVPTINHKYLAFFIPHILVS